jgi:tetratricopeptide (TPR) repeat protein
LGLFFGEGARAFAREDDPNLLEQQVLQLYQQGKYQEAIPLAEELVAMNKRTLGPDHPSTVTSLNNLAALYRAMGAYEKAEPLYQQACSLAGYYRKRNTG